MTVGKHSIAGRTKTCPSPSFDARNLKNAKWSSTEEINQAQGGRDLNFKEIPKTWTPRNQPSPSADKDFKKINFDTGSLKRVQRSVSSDSAYTSSDPKETFAWKDSTLDRKLKDLHAKKYSDAPEPKHNQNDNSLARTLENWKQTPLPKIEDPDVLLLKKARQEKKVKRYLEDNFKNRQGGYSECDNETEIGALQAKYFTLDHPTTGSPPRSPPPYSRGQSRFEREQNIKVGSLDSFSPCAPRQKSLSPPPSASSAQARYERERFRVQPGRIEDYRPGRCSVNEKRSTTPSAGGCSITKYSSAHSFNPILNSKSEHNISESDSSSNRERNLERKLSGYESDSSLSFRKHNYNPQTAPKSVKNLYNSIQRGGDVPMNGLKMSENDDVIDGSVSTSVSVPSIKVFQGATSEERQSSSSTTLGWEQKRWNEMREQETSEEMKKRQNQQLNQFYSTLSQQKECELRKDQESRKHHDTLLPNQKSPVPLNRYEDEAMNGSQAVFLNAGRRPEDCTMVAKALYSFQSQNSRELSFKKGDIIYIKKQIDGNWFEGERTGMVGIFPKSYVEILPNESAVTQEITKSLQRKGRTVEGEAKAKYSFAAQTPMELSLIKGETVTITRKVDSNWFEGKLGSRKGIFPISYVEILKEPREEKISNVSEDGRTSAAFTQSTSHQMHQSINKTSNSTAQMSASFSSTFERSKSGALSPFSNNSRPTSALSNAASQKSDKPEPVPYRAMYNYKPQNEDEVELCEGDVVFLMEKCDDGWFVGTSQRTGIFGTFPGNYVTQI